MDKNRPTPPAAPALEATTAPEVDSLFPQEEETGTEPKAGPELATQAFTGSPPAGAPAGPGTPPPSPASTLGNYRLLRKLGAGAMGSVYLARQVNLERVVALKVMSKELARDQAFVERFKREARVLAKLDHPHIVRCYDLGEDQGRYYLAMEFVDGGSLGDWIKKKGRLSLGDSLHIVLACAEGLKHAHDQNLIHRDVKPDNVLISRKGVVKLADLGLAKAMNEDLMLTRTGTGGGTPAFMAPEQARDLKHVDGRCDIYALGCVLYHCLTGQLPFTGTTLIEVLEAKESSRIAPLRRQNPAVPERLDLIIGKMLAPRVEYRYPSCGELIHDLEALKLAHPTLKDFGPEVESSPAAPARSTPAVPKAPSSHPTSPVPAPAPAKPQSKKPVPVKAPEPASSLEDEKDSWFVMFPGPQGRVVTKHLNTAQVLNLIRGEQFDPNMQASHNLNTGFQEVGMYTEFQQAVRARLTRDKKNKQVNVFRQMYDKIDEEETKRKRRRWFRHLFEKMMNGVYFLFWMAVLAAGVVGLFFLIRWLWHLLGAKITALWG